MSRDLPKSVNTGEKPPPIPSAGRTMHKNVPRPETGHMGMLLI